MVSRESIHFHLNQMALKSPETGMSRSEMNAQSLMRDVIIALDFPCCLCRQGRPRRNHTMTLQEAAKYEVEMDYQAAPWTAQAESPFLVVQWNGGQMYRRSGRSGRCRAEGARHAMPSD